MALVKDLQNSSRNSLISDLNLISLDNGVNLIHQQIFSSAVVVADVWVNAGVTSESESLSGMSHFLEHMIFKGTKNILPGEFDSLVESKGGFANAATSYDYTHFFLNTASNYLPEILPYFAEIILQPQIPDRDFYIERDVVLEELSSTIDDPDWIIFQSLIHSIYQHHPYRRSVLGEKPLLMSHTPEQMRSFHQIHYQPENINVVLVGNITQQKAVSLVEKNFQQFPPLTTQSALNNHFDSEPPLINTRRQKLFLPRLEQYRIVMGWMSSGIEDLEGAIALDMLSLILASGRSSRLVRKLREEEQILMNISCDFSLQKHSSLFTITAYSCIDNLEKIEAEIITHIRQLAKQPVSLNELTACQKSLCHDYIFSTETPEQLASLYGYYQILESASLASKYPQIVKCLSAEKLQQYASQYLSSEYYAVCYAYPKN